MLKVLPASVRVFYHLSESRRLTYIDVLTNMIVVVSGDVTAQVALQPALKFNGGGHINHTIFWTNLCPNGGGEPQGKENKCLKGQTLMLTGLIYQVHSHQYELISFRKM